MNLIEQILNDVVTPFLEPRIKKSSLKAVKGYVQGVQAARTIAIASFHMSVVAAALVGGVLMMVIAIVGLLPVDPRASLIGMLVVGAILVFGSLLMAYGGFKESVWLENSKAHELMEAAMKPWETPYSVPDPRKILMPQSQQAYEANAATPTRSIDATASLKPTAMRESSPS